MEGEVAGSAEAEKRGKMVRFADSGGPLSVEEKAEINVWAIGRPDERRRGWGKSHNLWTEADLPIGQLVELGDGRVIRVVDPSKSAEASARTHPGERESSVYVEQVLKPKVEEMKASGTVIPTWDELTKPIPVEIPGQKSKILI